MRNGDIVVADEEGVVVIGKDVAEQVFKKTQQKCFKEKHQSLEQWQAEHYKKISAALSKLGSTDLL
ncbi:hypothetical protein [Alginatibacterium sediminis]|uniref:hypothetical protein n=1 Tax=Alginatibacterium sediminis TaxID=2164068 RepID=UPI001314CCB0|nr:hypothetical protein [Alginatibacterium sediminis]